MISTAAAAVLGPQWRWPLVIVSGAAATLMAVRPLGSVRLLRKIMVWIVLAASVYLFVQVLARPAQPIPQEGVLGFWPGVDLAIAGVISFAPLAADYSRHSRTRKAAFWGASLGYGLAAIAYYILGVLAVANLGATDVIASLVALPAGAIALGILLVDEVDEAFANIYSTTMSVQNLFGSLDRRIVAVIIGVDRDADRRLPGLQPVPVVPVLDRLGVRAAVRRGDRRLLPRQRAALGRLGRPRGCGWCRSSPGPPVSWPTSSSTPVRCRAGRTSGARGRGHRLHPADLARLLGGRDRRRWGDHVRAGPAHPALVQRSQAVSRRPVKTAATRRPKCRRCDGSADCRLGAVLIFAHRGILGPAAGDDQGRVRRRRSPGPSETQIPLALECDVQFSADDQLICLHDLIARPDLQRHRTGVRAHAGRAAAARLRLLGRAATERGSAPAGDPGRVADHGRRSPRPGRPGRPGHRDQAPQPARARHRGAGRAPCWSRTAGTVPGRPVRLISFSVPALRAAARAAAGPGADPADRARPRGVGRRPAARRRPARRGRSRAAPRRPGLRRRGPAGTATRCTSGPPTRPRRSASASTLGVAGITTDHPDRVAAALAG